MRPDHYRQQAERARRLADSLIDRDAAKEILLQVAQEYDELAEHAETGAASSEQSECS